MDRVIDLTEIVQREVADYNSDVEDYKAHGYFSADPERRIYSIIIVPDKDHPTVRRPVVMMMARVVNDKVIIDADTTDRPLYQELMRCGIPREQIILAYAGEKPPDAE